MTMNQAISARISNIVPASTQPKLDLPRRRIKNTEDEGAG
jgi:hypothetical protein